MSKLGFSDLEDFDDGLELFELCEEEEDIEVSKSLFFERGGTGGASESFDFLFFLSFFSFSFFSFFAFSFCSFSFFSLSFFSIFSLSFLLLSELLDEDFDVSSLSLFLSVLDPLLDDLDVFKSLSDLVGDTSL